MSNTCNCLHLVFLEGRCVKFDSWGSLGARNMFDHIYWQAEASGVCKGESGHGFR